LTGTELVASFFCSAEMMVGPGRVELPTSRLSGVRSNHLSYEPSADAAFKESAPAGNWWS
jgi:hypothetical protein